VTYYVAASYDGTDCGHAHTTREGALPCRTRLRPRVERVEVPPPVTVWEKVEAWVYVLLVAGLAWYLFHIR
jgi:hypothetical protein